MSIKVRPAQPEDAATIVDFNQRLAQESEGKTLNPDKVRAGVAKALADPTKGLYFVAEAAGQVVGQLMLTLEWSDWRDGWFWWIQSVYVRQDARQRGVFRALYEHVQEQALANPEVVGIRLYVEEHNQKAQATYLKLGMDRTGYQVMERGT